MVETNEVVKIEGIGIQVKGIMGNVKSSIDSYVTEMRTPILAMLTKFGDDENNSQCFRCDK